MKPLIRDPYAISPWRRRNEDPVTTVSVLAVLLVVCGWGSRARADLPLDAVPPDAAAAYIYAGPTSSDASPPAGLSWSHLLRTMVDGASRTGMLSSLRPQARGWMDALAGWSEATAYPHALVLLDVQAAPRADGGHRLDRMDLALVLRTDGRTADIEKRIQHLLTTYTNTSQTRLKTVTRNGMLRYELRDRRLDEWSVICWGRVGRDYVIAFGEGAFARMERLLGDRESSLAAASWAAPAVAADAGSPLRLAMYLNLRRLKKSADAPFAAKVAQAAGALGVGGAEQVLITVRRPGRAFSMEAILVPATDASSPRDGAAVRRLRLAGPVGPDDPLARFIPEGATGYTVIEQDAAPLLSAVVGAYLSARSPKARARLRAFWERVEAESGVHWETDLLPHLRGPIIIHNDPPHLLRLPGAVSILVPLAPGSGERVRTSLDRLFSFAQRHTEPDSWLRLVRDADGVWFLSYGLSGPAVVVEGEWLVIAYSPAAARVNRDRLRRVGGAARSVDRFPRP